MCHRNQVEKGKDMDIIKKYKWDIFPLAILVIVVAIVTTQPSKKTKGSKKQNLRQLQRYQNIVRQVHLKKQLVKRLKRRYNHHKASKHLARKLTE